MRDFHRIFVEKWLPATRGSFVLGRATASSSYSHPMSTPLVLK